jgi:hypothetical protein
MGDFAEHVPQPRRKCTQCPECGGGVRLILAINWLVCKDCCELLYVNELIPA